MFCLVQAQHQILVTETTGTCSNGASATSISLSGDSAQIGESAVPWLLHHNVQNYHWPHCKWFAAHGTQNPQQKRNFRRAFMGLAVTGGKENTNEIANQSPLGCACRSSLLSSLQWCLEIFINKKCFEQTSVCMFTENLDLIFVWQDATTAVANSIFPLETHKRTRPWSGRYYLRTVAHSNDSP